jgi:hypothetical protein
MTFVHRHQALVLLLGTVLTLVATTGFIFLRYAPSADNTITLPIEVIGPDGYTQTVTVMGSNASGAQHLYLQAHSIGYPYYEDYTVNKASIRINGGPWTDVTNDVATCQFPESNLDCVGGPYPTIRFEVPVADIGGSLQDGSNTIDFRFNYAFPADSPDDFGSASTGYRILDMELRDGGDTDLIDGTTFVWDDPATWTPPEGFDDPQSISEGETLWHQRDILIDAWDSHEIQASCADCHAADGRDLQYFAFSNASIIARSEFHGLTTEEGKKIAAYIRSQELQDVDDGHTYAPPARPWTPVYQPGPTSRASRGEDADRAFGTAIHEMPSNGSQYLAAGAGIEWALDRDEEAIPYLWPNGPSKADFDPVDSNSLKMWHIPNNLQFADWNEWLPTHHPIDMYGLSAFQNGEGNVWNYYYGEGVEGDFRHRLEQCWASNGNVEQCHDEGATFLRIWKAVQLFNKSKPPLAAAYQNMTDESVNAFANVNLAKWATVKQWEIVHTYDLEDEDTGDGDLLGWPRAPWSGQRFPFDLAPHIMGAYAGAKDGSYDIWLDNTWYELNTRINHGRDQGTGLRPNDWKYHFMHINGFDGFGINTALRRWTAITKVFQNCDAFEDGGSAEPRAWYTRTGHCGAGTAFWWGGGRKDQLDSYQARLGLDVHEAWFRYITENMMYQHSPVTYDPSTGVFTGDVDANWERKYSLRGWEPEEFTPYLTSSREAFFDHGKTPNHYLNAIDRFSDWSMDPALLDSAAAWGNAMNPADVWDNYRCQSVGGLLDCSLPANQSIQLQVGWNYISSYVAPQDSAIEQIFANTENLVMVKDNHGRTYIPSLGVDQLGSWSSTDGYKVRTESMQELTLSGETIEDGTSIELHEGWNLLPVHASSEVDIVDALSPIGDALVIVRDEEGNVYEPDVGTNEIGTLVPGDSYEVYVSTDVTFAYPSGLN